MADILVTTYLEMRDRTSFRPAYLHDSSSINIMLMGIPDVCFYRFLYRTVGEKWCWRDRLKLSDREMEAILAEPGTSVHVLYVRGTPAGYIELSQGKQSTEIAYFGLRSSYMGKGLGKHLLSYGVDYGWDRGAKRLWVHTCSLDGPYALNNYLKRGFKIYNSYEEPMPNRAAWRQP
ncbi:MAG: GNAT family N-acetyltransferase [Hormoscilla sp. GUM202]|nr:GNAT family N-acetyltransferase [Hormoscilla sp. GUM202]